MQRDSNDLLLPSAIAAICIVEPYEYESLPRKNFVPGMFDIPYTMQTDVKEARSGRNIV
jgi:hypothetical protein